MINNSAAGARDYEDWLSLKPGTVKVIANGVDVPEHDVFSDAPSELTAWMAEAPDQTVIVGGVLRMSHEKGPDLWLDVARQVVAEQQNVGFVCLGDGPEYGQLAAKIRENDLTRRILLPGYSSNVFSWLKHFDLLLGTSRTEGLPNALIEAQMLGIPVVATDVGGTSEAVLHGTTGLLSASGDAKGLKASLVHLIDNKSIRQDYAASAKKHAQERFSTEAMLDATLSSYGVPFTRPNN